MSSLRPSALPAGFIAPCLPTRAPCPPSGPEWLIEIKHDGFRVIARKDGKRVRLYSRPGNDLTYRFPLIVEALGSLRLRSCIIDGEAVACGGDGIASFDRIRYRRHDIDVFMWAFDLIELNGDDVRRDPLAVRKATLGRILARAPLGMRFNEHLDEEDGPLVFHHACKLGLEGIVSKRRDSVYSSGRSPHWIKSKNPNAPAVRRGIRRRLVREEKCMAKKTKRGRSQDRKRVAGGQDYEVRYEAKKTGKSKGAVKRAIKRAGPSRKSVKKALGK
jgi:bifunctional non-homologous end joining protein LigD